MSISGWWRNLHTRYTFLTDSAALFSSNLVNGVLGFIFWIVAARIYPEQTVGTASALMSAMYLIGNLSRLGLDYTLVIELPKETRPGLRSGMSTMSLLVVAIVGALLAFLFAVQNSFAVNATAILSQNAAIVFGFMVCCSLWGIGLVSEQILLLNHLGHYIVYKNMIFSVAKIAALVLLLPFTGREFGVLASIAVGIVLGMVTIWKALTSDMAWQPELLQESVLRLTSSLAAPALKNFISATVVGLPNWLLPLIVVDRLGTGAAAHFYASWMIFIVVNNGPAALGNSLLVEGARRGNASFSLLCKAYKYMLIFVIPAIVFLLIGPQYILRVFGAAYTDDGSQLLRYLALAVIPYGFIHINFMKLRGDGRLGILIILSVLLSLCVLLGSFMLLPSRGLEVIGLVWLLMCSFIGALSFVPIAANWRPSYERKISSQ
jgi:O-antigen/teichoic acid export membrane protein